ncbi:sulfatase [Candidatus Hydrogenedentota bacterium]
MNAQTVISALVLCATVLGMTSVGHAATPERPNVLFIAIDDMNDWIGAFNGRAKTPNIDRLASQGLLFTNAHCVVPACNPSRTALMTGQRPETTKQFGNQGNFRDQPGGADRVTLPQHFRASGYEAVAAGKIFHYGRGGNEEPDPISDPQSWNAQRKGWIGTGGHDLYLDENGWGKWHGGEFKEYLGKYGVWGPIPDKTEETHDWKSADYCAQYLKKSHDKPFFLACGIFRPHSPQLAPQKYFDMYPLEEIVLPEVPEDDFDDIPAIAHKNFSTDFFVDGVKAKGEWKKAVQGYLASMTFADDCVGHLLKALDDSEYKDNTIVVLWTDHGWQLGHKNRWEKFTLWRQSTHTPLMFKVPGVTKPGGVCERAVSFLDIYPTLSALCGLPERPELEGHSLVPLMEDPKRKWKYPAVISNSWGEDYSVEYEQWNYIRYQDGSEELYDHTNDIHEFRNLAGLAKYDDIKRQLAKWIPGSEAKPELQTPESTRVRKRHAE